MLHNAMKARWLATLGAFDWMSNSKWKAKYRVIRPRDGTIWIGIGYLLL
jgi:hypothetical protein